jgi:hypothetical protein
VRGTSWPPCHMIFDDRRGETEETYEQFSKVSLNTILDASTY